MKKKSSGLILKLLLLVIIVLIITAIVYVVTNNKEEEQQNENEVVITPQNQVVEEFVQVLDDGTKLNTSSKLQEAKKIDGLEIRNIQITNTDNNGTIILADVENKSSNATELLPIKLILLDKEGNKIIELKGNIDGLQPGGKTQLNMGVSADFANVYDFVIEKR